MTRIGKPPIGGFGRIGSFGGSCRQAIRRNIKAAAALAAFFFPAALAGPNARPQDGIPFKNARNDRPKDESGENGGRRGCGENPGSGAMKGRAALI